jgi:hypothetical protein
MRDEGLGIRYILKRMARGWESKSIEAQQEEAARPKSAAPLSEAERIKRERRRTLEMARTRAAADLAVATADPHRRMLQHALEALDAQLREF